MKVIECYTDGACKGNPGPGGWGCIIHYSIARGLKMIWRTKGGSKRTTNNEMELTAILVALRECPSGRITIHSDSTYCIKGIVGEKLVGTISSDENMFGKRHTVFKGWCQNWIENGWKTYNGTPVRNLQLWKDVVVACEDHIQRGSTLKFKWVKAHADNEGNNNADLLANQGVPK